MGKTTTLNKPKPGIFYGYWVLASSFVCLMFMSGFHTYSFGLFVKELEGAFGWSRQSISLASTISTFAHGIGAIFVGQMVDRLGSRRIIIVGAVVVCLGYLFMSYMKELWQFYLFYGFAGLGFAGVGFGPASAVIFNWFKKRRGTFVGIAGVGIGTGGFLMPLLVGGYLIPNFGWSTSFRVMGLLISAVVVPLTVFVLKNRPEEMGLTAYGAEDAPSGSADRHAAGRSEGGLSLKEALRTQTFWLIALTGMAFGFGTQSLLQHQAAHLQDIGFELAAVAGTLSIGGIINSGAKFCFGWLCDIVRPKYVRALGLSFQMASVLLLMAVKPSSSLAAVTVYAVFTGLTMGSWLPSMSMLVSTSFGLAAYTTIFSITGFFNMSGGALGPYFSGYIFDTRGSYQLAFTVISILSASGVIATLFIRQPKGYRYERGAH